MDPFSDFDPFSSSVPTPAPLAPQSQGYPDVSNLFNSDAAQQNPSNQQLNSQTVLSENDLFDILGTDNKSKENDDSKMTPTTNNRINAMSVEDQTEEQQKKEPEKQKTIVERFQEIMEPDETEIKALELFNTVESHISALKSHYEELKSCLQTMQDILYPPEESFEAKFKKTHKKQNQENKGVNHKFKSLFGRNNEAESAEQEQHKVKGAGSTIKEKQHEALDKAYTDFLKTHDLLGKSVDASKDAKEELQKYLNLCQKSKQISILYQNDDGEMSLSRAEQRKEWFNEFKKRMTMSEAGPLNIMYNNFVSDIQNRIDSYKKEKETIEKRRELRREGKLKPTTPPALAAATAGYKLASGIKMLKEKVKERAASSSKGSDLNSDLFDILTPELSNNSNKDNNNMDILSDNGSIPPITPNSNTDIDEDEQDQKRLEQLEQEYIDNPIYDRIHNFLDEFMYHVEENSAWKGASDELLQGARDAFEKMIIMKFSNETILKIRNELKEDDVSLYNRTWDLSFISPKELDFDSNYIKPEMMEMAVEVLRRMDLQPSPCEQMDCIVEASRIVGTMISLNDKDANGADDFLPAFIFTLLHAKIGHAKSTIDFIEKIRGPSALRANAIAFIEQVDASLLRMDENEFNTKIQESREKYCDHYNDVSLRDK